MKFTWRSPVRLTAALWRAFVFLCHGRPVIAPEDIQLERDAQCHACEHRIAEMCGLCDCYIPAKTLLSSEQCPDDPPRWKRIAFSKKPPTPNELTNG